MGWNKNINNSKNSKDLVFILQKTKIRENEIKKQEKTKMEKQTKNKKVWGYTDTHKRYFGQIPKGQFIEQVAEMSNSSKYWVSQRISDTGNTLELEKARAEPNKIFVKVEQKMETKKYKVLLTRYPEEFEIEATSESQAIELAKENAKSFSDLFIWKSEAEEVEDFN